MLKKILKFIVLILIMIGIICGISVSMKKSNPEKQKKEFDSKFFDLVQTREAEVTSFYTYGKAFNLSGKIVGINKDNFESVKLVVMDGIDYEKSYKLNYEFDKNTLFFSSDNEINSGIIIDELEEKEYICLIRVKLNNSIDAKYYSLNNSSEYQNIEYYTITKDGENKKADIGFLEKNKEDKTYSYLSINLENNELPEEVYDIVIDAGHGGKDTGEKLGSDTEANISLEYAYLLKSSLENEGYKVKLTRDNENSEFYNSTNMYDSGGRISSACKSKAKLMISFHVNNGVNKLSGLEIYCPCKSNLIFAQTMANKINEYTNINFSNNNSFKQLEGVYVRNFTKTIIKEYENTAKKKGYEPYPLTEDTPYLYTIREVGGIATNAYVDGRNKDYSANAYYNSNQGIECYQIELGYIKNDLNIIKNEKEGYIRAITESIVEFNK